METLIDLLLFGGNVFPNSHQNALESNLLSYLYHWVDSFYNGCWSCQISSTSFWMIASVMFICVSVVGFRKLFYKNNTPS